MLLASRVHQHPSPGSISQLKGLSKWQSFCDIDFFHEYRYDSYIQDYTDTCTNDQLTFIYANQGYMEGTGDERYDLDPDTVPADSVLFNDFDSVERTPLTKGLIADCEVYRIADQNTFIASTVKNEDMRDGGISYTRKDGIESVLKEFTKKR